MDILDSNVPSYTTDYKNAKQMSSQKKMDEKNKLILNINFLTKIFIKIWP